MSKMLEELKDHSACGIGITANINGLREHGIVQEALEKLACMDSRGGTHIEHNTGDGAGIKTQIPTKIFQAFLDEKQITVTLKDGEFGVGQLFLPQNEVKNMDGLTPSQLLVEEQLKKNGLIVLGWRDVPVNKTDMTSVAKQKLPNMQQVIFGYSENVVKNDFEKLAIQARIDIENAAKKLGNKLYVASFSSESIVYKGMFRASEIPVVYPDLSNPLYETSYTEIHNRMSTNTNPEHSNAQPCRYVSINGEMNTIQKNEMDIKIHTQEVRKGNGSFVEGISDSLRFDEDLSGYMLEGYSMSEALTLLMPPVIDEKDTTLSDDAKAMLKWFQRLRTSYNGPSHTVFAAGNEIGGKLDSSGLRPSRVVITDENGKQRFHIYSEDLVDIPIKNIVARFSLRPGEMVMVKDGKVLRNTEILESLAAQKPKGYYQSLLAEHTVPLTVSQSKVHKLETSMLSLRERQEMMFWDQDTAKMMILPMAEEGEQKVFAMGDDTPMSAMSDRPLHISTFAKQKFAQVTNPPLDPIREKSSFTPQVHLGANPLVSPHAKQVVINSPILKYGELQQIEQASEEDIQSHRLDMTFQLAEGEVLSDQKALGTSMLSMREAIAQLCLAAEKAVLGGASILILSDKNVGKTRAPIPDALAVAAVNKHLTEKGLRLKTSIIAESGQVVSPHQASVLLSFGASVVSPYLAYEEIRNLSRGHKKYSFAQLRDNYHAAMTASHIKTMAKMGITTAESYNGSELMEFLGLNLDAKGSDIPVAVKPSLSNIFKGCFSPISGLHLGDIAYGSIVRHQVALSPRQDMALPDNGLYAYRRGGIPHGYGPDTVDAFSNWLGDEAVLDQKGQSQLGVKVNGHYTKEFIDSFQQTTAYKKFSKTIQDIRRENPTSIMDEMEVAPSQKSVSLEEVQPISSIVKKSYSGGMSYGALTRGAWETISEAENAIFSGSNSGEGGEREDNFGTNKNAKVKQIASGRFGISPEMLAAIPKGGLIEIKVAQGAKPGEGGQLPGDKVSVEIAALRGSIPGVPLISPPPHHDIYSIEDLKELIHDLKSAGVKVGVKLVASSGIGTIACGVVKAGADEINIAGHSGGTGAASVTSIKNTGMPAEIGLSIVDQALRASGMRDAVKLKTSGAFKNGWDIVKAAILGADRFEWGTTELMLVGCKMLRLCNKPGGCSPGVTNSGELFRGEGKDIERFKLNVAAEVREILASLGFKSLKEIQGHTELLSMRLPEHLKGKFDFGPMFYRPERVKISEQALERHRKGEKRKDDVVLEKIQPLWESKPSKLENIPSVSHSNNLSKTEEYVLLEPIELTPNDRAFGAKIAVEVSKHLKRMPDNRVDTVKHESKQTTRFTAIVRKQPKLELLEGQRFVGEDYLIINTRGNAGQSFGFVNAHGMYLRHEGVAQDGVGKSMAGGVIAIVTPKAEHFKAHENVIIGNACFYGAYAGKGFINGQAGNRFAVELHGASVVVEGVGDYACEFMTSGTFLNLGKVGSHFGVGMSGGIAIQYDPANTFLQTADTKSIRLADNKESEAYHDVIYQMLSEHKARTGSEEAARILGNWEQEKGNFKVAIPHTMDKLQSKEQLKAIEETFSESSKPVSMGMETWYRQKVMQQSSSQQSYNISW